MAEIKKCIICEGDFHDNTLEDGKCVSCHKQYPSADNREQALAMMLPARDRGEMKMTEERVRAIFKEESLSLRQYIDEKIDAKFDAWANNSIDWQVKETE